VTRRPRAATSRLFIGTDDPAANAEGVAADGQQSFRTIGARLRDETFTINLVAEGWDGGNTMKTARDAAVAVEAGVELFLRPTAAATQNYTISGTVMWAGIGRETMSQSWTDAGAYCRISFSIDARANLNQ